MRTREWKQACLSQYELNIEDMTIKVDIHDMVAYVTETFFKILMYLHK